MNNAAPRTSRKHSHWTLARRILKEIRSHPANSAAPNRSVLRAVGWQLRKRLRRGEVTIDAYGLDLRLPRISGSLSNYFYFGEAFEWQTINFVRAYLRPGDVVADVGANVGMFTYAATQIVGADGKVHAFEPLPWAAEAIRRNVESNDLDMIVIHQVAVSDQAGMALFTSDLDVSSHLEWESRDSVSTQTANVRISPLDDELDADTRLALAKIDVEGAEMLVLAGFERGLATHNPPVIVIEALDHSLRRMKSSKAEVLQILETAGYGFFAFDVGSGCLTSAGRDHGCDLIAIALPHLSSVSQRLATESEAFISS